MAFEMDALNGFLRMGPQVYPARPNAVQVIERGPHGKRLAADPVLTREGRTRGSGFRSWVEQMNVPANESWNPPQRVVGLLGLGEQSPNASELQACSAGAPSPPSFGSPPAGGDARSLWVNLNDAAGAACRGRVEPAKKILEGAWRFFGGRLSASDQASFAPLVQRARDYISLVESGGQAPRMLKETEVREAEFQGRMSDWEEKNGASARAEEQRMVECARGGSMSYAACIAMQDPGGAAQAALTGKPPASWSEGINTDAGVRRARGECVGVDPGCWARKSWKPALVGAAVLVGVYALATAFGRR